MKKNILYVLVAMLCPFLKVSGQQANTLHAVKGLVAGNKEMPLAGATVKWKGNGGGVHTNKNGVFVITTRDTSGILIISFIGYHTKEVNWTAGHPILSVIVLSADAGSLREVTIVSTGYQHIAKDRATGSFALVDSQLFNRRVSPDVLSRLEGIVPGLLFNRNTYAAANGAADISVRGTSTLFASSQPLIVVDGFPYDGDINNIDPNTVENISVLKDAAAASIWGVKSGNGVIVITTRHGIRNKKLAVNFNASVTIGDKPDLFYNPDFLNSNDFINVEETLFKQGFYDGALGTPYAEVSPVVAILAQQRAGTIATAAANAQINAFRTVDVRNDLSAYFYRRSAEQQYALDVSGGGPNNDYFISGGYDKNLTNETGNQNSRASLNTVYNYYPVKHLTVTAGLNFTENMSTANSPLASINGGGGYPSAIYPYAQLADRNGNALPIVYNYASAYTDTAGGGKFYNWQYRPLDELHNADNTSESLDNRINLSAKYTFLSGFTAEARYEYENQQSHTNDYFSDQTYYTRNLVNEFTTADAYGNMNYPVPQGGILQPSNGSLVAQRGRFQLDYNNFLGPKNELTAIAGAEINQTVLQSDAETVYGYSKNTLTDQNADFVDYFPTNPTGNYLQIPNSESLGEFTNRYVSYFSNAAYTYDSRYTFSLSGRIDKSNLFGVSANQQSVPLYSTGFAWNISKEGFYNVSWLPYLKARVTYGYNGNVDNNVTALTTFQQVSGAPFTGNPYAVIVSPGDPELQWEKVRIINFGIDYAAKNQVISGSFEYYLKRGLDLIGDSPLAPSTGFVTFRGNTANISGNGLDVVLNANIINNKRFRWQSNFLLSYVLDKVTKYDAQPDVASYLELGAGNAGTIYPLTNRPLYAIYSYKWAGLTHNTGDPQGYLNGAVSTDYAAIIANTTTDNMVYNGPSRPTTFGSFRNTFSYEKFSLSLNVIYKLNYYFRRTSINYTSLFNGWTGNRDFDKRWQTPGDELHTSVPSIEYTLDPDRDAFYEYSGELVDNGDNIRLQDINLSYNLLSRSASKKLPFSQLQVYSYINNAGILWRANHDGLDPDLYTGALPVPRTYSIGFKATF